MLLFNSIIILLDCSVFVMLFPLLADGSCYRLYYSCRPSAAAACTCSHCSLLESLQDKHATDCTKREIELEREMEGGVREGLGFRVYLCVITVI